jgi:hypothetical protein
MAEFTLHSSTGGTVSQLLQIYPVENRAAMRQFIRLPWSIYAADPMWIPPLLMERRQHLASRNPYFKHARWRAWLAYRGHQPVGRISAQVDELHLSKHQDKTGFFGMLEAEDNLDTFRRLLHSAETWLRTQGLSQILGPFNLSINHDIGLLVDGFDSSPNILMGHARPYYAPHLEALNYFPAKDLLAYRLKADFTPPAAVQALTSKSAENLSVRSLRRTDLTKELSILRDIFNDAWSDNWNFVPFTEAEFLDLGRNLMHLISDDFVQIVEFDGNPVAMIVLLPNLNEIIRDLNGRLLPFGWFKLLWRLKWRYPKTARVPLMGVRRQFQNSLLGSALAFKAIEALRVPARKRNIQQVELSWILEDNVRMRSIIEALGGEIYKRYRVYQKSLP